MRGHRTVSSPNFALPSRRKRNLLLHISFDSRCRGSKTIARGGLLHLLPGSRRGEEHGNRELRRGGRSCPVLPNPSASPVQIVILFRGLIIGTYSQSIRLCCSKGGRGNG
ncbi:hypothetical protein L596_019767 [Steinernema carpocapsae]|uniref:Uncharacterized protein n=1 Tax=Steinernema carpocapsae TaxID=34508 RepID=A0A4V6A0P4_STECR|nr:hypothetical protein L596_019767 [Steinernema carpocapsae]